MIYIIIYFETQLKKYYFKFNNFLSCIYFCLYFRYAKYFILFTDVIFINSLISVFNSSILDCNFSISIFNCPMGDCDCKNKS